MPTTYTVCKSIARALAWVAYDYRVIHPEKLITDGPALIVCNHESYLDPPMVGIAWPGEIAYLARKTLFRGFGAWLYPRLNVVPVDQEGPDFTGLKNIIKLLRGGQRVLLFPEGARSWDGTLQPGEAGVGLVVSKARVPVQPVRLLGTHQALPRGGGMVKPSKIRLVVGDPIHFPAAALAGKSRESYQAISDQIMQAIEKLQDD
jgi:1-acyl-sn-glycerol-3-phosphate acyltransferase